MTIRTLEARTTTIGELVAELQGMLAESGDGPIRIGDVRPHGWVLVPAVATGPMLGASILRCEQAHRDYVRMVAAAPKIDPARADCVRPLEGGSYMQRNGGIVGPMRANDDGQFVWTDGRYSWRADGSISAYAGRDDGSACGMDLVAVHDPVAVDEAA